MLNIAYIERRAIFKMFTVIFIVMGICLILSFILVLVLGCTLNETNLTDEEAQEQIDYIRKWKQGKDKKE